MVVEINGEPVRGTSETVIVASKLRAVQCAVRLKDQDETLILASTSSGLGAFTRAPGYDHDRFGTVPSDIRLELRAYTCSFDGPDDDNGDGVADIWAIPHWVSFQIKAQGKEPIPERRNSFATDSVLNRLGLVSSSGRWARFGYDRGHMCPSATARRLGVTGDTGAFLMTNFCPQRPQFNRRTWVALEQLEREWADRFGSVWVTCGPVVFGNTPEEFIEVDGDVAVAVPHAFFRIIVRETDNGLSVLPFVAPQSAEHRQLSEWTPHLTSVDVIEALTGLDFFTNADIPE